MKIIITGFMGSGKSIVGHALAQLLRCEMIDLDEVIKREEGRSVRQIIEADGETSFRGIESRVLGKVVSGPTARIVALGGGAWISEENRKQILEQGWTSVWLDAPFSLCWKRIAVSGDQRPLARSEADALNLYTERRSRYELADVRVQITEHQSTDEIAAEIVQSLASDKDEARDQLGSD